MLGRLILYTKNKDAMVAFYTTHFGYSFRDRPGDRLTEMVCADEGPNLLLHDAAKAQKEGQAQVKMVFDVADVTGKRKSLIAAGVDVGPLHDGDGYQFANLKDPSSNSVQISNRCLIAP